jgi:hypothetical protein
MVWATLVTWLEILGASRPLPRQLEERIGIGLARGAWWLLLFLLAWAFAGRTTKFVYVDF